MTSPSMFPLHSCVVFPPGVQAMTRPPAPPLAVKIITGALIPIALGSPRIGRHPEHRSGAVGALLGLPAREGTRHGVEGDEAAVPVVRISRMVEAEVEEAASDHEVAPIGRDEKRRDDTGGVAAGGGVVIALSGVALEPAGVARRWNKARVEGAAGGVDGGQLVLVARAEPGESAGDVEPGSGLGDGGDIAAGFGRVEGPVDLAGGRVQGDQAPSGLTVDPVEFAADVEAAPVG